ncbi:uncharacterized protein J7T54_000234 [Emericellopsis cladophorae]|uniref:Uncharacterized protein n=1 Tax=Emericellopsis cladophorae TaxID=2686198 RepID=A0A9P9XXZ4_9HYPO|nr:uncharacterized protein J7T54_000234 [Emericellopsis cladophorae]KAI6779934.1 hypothetical protein J7T54_000234 [Emericellopsis cladophorae]
MPSLLDKLQSKLELLRLEKRYTRSRHRRSHFVSGAVYVDGEYVFQTPNSTGSSKSSSHTTVTGTPGVDALHGDYYAHSSNKAYAREPAVDVIAEEDRAVEEEFQRKRMNRFSAMPSMSSLRRETETPEETHQRKKLNRFSSIAGFGRDYDVNNKALPARPKESRRLSMLR